MLDNLFTRTLKVYDVDNKNNSDGFIEIGDELTFLKNVKCATYSSQSIASSFPQQEYEKFDATFIVNGDDQFPKVKQVIEFDNLKYKILSIKKRNLYANQINKGVIIGVIRFGD